MNFLDLFFTLIFLWAAAKGYRRGALRAIAGIAGYLAAVWAAITYGRPFNSWLNSNLHWSDTLSRWLTQSLPVSGGGQAGTIPWPPAGGAPAPGPDSGVAALPPAWSEFLSQFLGPVLPTLGSGPGSGDTPLPGVLGPGQWDAALGSLTSRVAGLLVQGAAFLLIFLAALWGVKLLAGLTSRGLGRGALHSLNRWAGLAVELVLAAAVWSVVVGVTGPWLGLGSSLQGGAPLTWLGSQLATSRLVPVLLTLFAVLSSRVYTLF